MAKETKTAKGGNILHQILAVLPESNALTRKFIGEAEVTFKKRVQHFVGGTRTIRYFNDERVAENTSDSKEVAETVTGKLDHVFNQIAKTYDLILMQDSANQKAVADIILEDGTVIAENVPVQTLLTFENRMSTIRDLIAAAPTLDPNMAWTEDVNNLNGVYRSGEVVSFKTEKAVSSVVLYEATEHHPAQVDKITSDVSVASITTTSLSGMMSVVDKSNMLQRVDDMSAAIKRARMLANTIQVENMKIGGDIFGYIRG